MQNLPFGALDIRSAGRWSSAVAQGLEELLGYSGARAVLRKALADAHRRRPELGLVLLGRGDSDLTALCLAGLERCEDASLKESLEVLAESLRLLLSNLMGEELTSELMSVVDELDHADCSSLLGEPA